MSAFFITAFLSDILTPDEMVSLNLDSGILKLYFVVCCNVDLLVVVGMFSMCFGAGLYIQCSAGSHFQNIIFLDALASLKPILFTE